VLLTVHTPARSWACLNTFVFCLSAPEKCRDYTGAQTFGTAIDPSFCRGFNCVPVNFVKKMFSAVFRTLGSRIVGVVCLAIVLTLATGLWVIYDRTYDLVTQSMRDKMQAMLVQAESTTDSMGALVEAQAFDYQRLTAELAAKGHENYRDTTFYQTVPVVASWAAIRQSIEGTPIAFRIVRDKPRNPDNAPANAFERRVLDTVQTPGTGSWFVVDREAGVVAYARPVTMSQSCMLCHGDPANSLTQDGKDVLGFTMEGWKPGELRGAYVLTAPLSEVDRPLWQGMRRALLWSLPAALAVLLLSAWVVVRINKSLYGTTRSLSANSEKLTEASEQVARTGMELSEGATEQAATLEETSASLEELNVVTRANAEAAAGAKDISAQAKEMTESGLEQMAQMQRAMADIKDASDRVSKIIRTIDEIAFQTNILALNAAAEAARAGQAGLGFAVVADEVRNLSRRSADAARETASIIELSLRTAQEGGDMCDGVQNRLEKISQKICALDETIVLISQASREQSQGIAMINTAVNQLSEVTQGNAANAESSANASVVLQQQAKDLHASVTAMQAMISERKRGAVALR
jgi:methyl-accepting chemotaxis protein